MSDIDKFKELKENCFGGIHTLLIKIDIEKNKEL